MVGKWRELFESGVEPTPDWVAGQEFEFGSPATGEELAAAEQALGVALPSDVRELLAEFNGVWRRNRYHHGGESREITYLDTETLSVDVPDYFADCGNPLPTEADLRKVVWVCQSNGFGDLWGVCVVPVAGHAAGAVVRLDHEVGELEACRSSLAEFVRYGHAAAPAREPVPGDAPETCEPAWKERVAARPPRCLAGFDVTLVRRDATDLSTYLRLSASQAVFALACRCGGRHFKVHGRTRPDPATGAPTFGGPLAAECVACGTLTPIFDPASHGAASGRPPAAPPGVPTVETCCYCGAKPAEVLVGFEYPDAWTAAADTFRDDAADAFALLELDGRCAACGGLLVYARLACGGAGPA